MEESRTSGAGRGLAAGWQGLIAVVLSAGLYLLAFPPLDLPETAYVFALPLLLHAFFSKPFRGEGWLVLLGGWLAWFVLLIWLRNVTAHLSSPFAGALGWLAVVSLSGIMALFWWAWFALLLRAVRAVRGKGLPARLGAVLTLSASWVLLEWIRGFLFTGFPWLPLSASQWERPLLLQIASLTGASGVSFVLVAFNLGLGFYLYNLWVNRRQRWWRRLSVEFYLSLGILFGAIAFGLQSSGAGKRGIIEGPRLGFVQPNVGALEKWEPGMVEENLDLLEDLTTYAAYLGAELILWPEAPTPYAVKGSPRMRAWVDALAREAGVPMLIGNLAVETGPGEDQRRYYNAVFTVSPDAGVDLERYYAKRHLVPFGEYLPMGDWIPFGRTVVPIPVDMTPGTQARPLRLPGSAGEVGILICYEDIFSGLARDNVRAGADWHYVATNNAWFGEEAAGWQHAAHSVLRAVETRRPVVRCGNAGWSGWIDEFGQIRHAMTDEAGSVYFQGVEAVPFQRNRWWSGRQSVYVAHGDWFPLVCAVLAGLGWMVFRFVPGSRGDRPGFVQSRLGRVSSGG